MRINYLQRFCCMCSLAVALNFAGIAFAQSTTAQEAGNASLAMPVLTGEEWQKLEPESKITFIWGVGHVVTIEEHVVQRHPELKRADFTAKLAEGLRGLPMNAIIQQVDSYYQANPDELNQPVMRVIWRQIVKPKLTTGIADQPLQETEHK